MFWFALLDINLTPICSNVVRFIDCPSISLGLFRESIGMLQRTGLGLRIMHTRLYLPPDGPVLDYYFSKACIPVETLLLGIAST